MDMDFILSLRTDKLRIHLLWNILGKLFTCCISLVAHCCNFSRKNILVSGFLHTTFFESGKSGNGRNRNVYSNRSIVVFYNDSVLRKDVYEIRLRCQSAHPPHYSCHFLSNHLDDYLHLHKCQTDGFSKVCDVKNVVFSDLLLHRYSNIPWPRQN